MIVITYTFSPNTIIRSAHVNQNFTDCVTWSLAHETSTTGDHGITSGVFVGTTMTQTLTNKTLVSPIVTGNLDLHSGANLRMYSDAGVTLTFVIDGATGDFGIPATRRFYLDGTGLGGDTYIYEASANTLDIVAGGFIARLTTTAFQLDSVHNFVISPTKRLYYDGGGDTYRHESAANDLIDVVGGTNMLEQYYNAGNPYVSLNSARRLIFPSSTENYHIAFNNPAISAFGSMYSSGFPFTSSNATPTCRADEWTQVTGGSKSTMLEVANATNYLAFYQANAGTAAGTKAAFWGNPVFKVSYDGATYSQSVDVLGTDGNYAAHFGDDGGTLYGEFARRWNGSPHGPDYMGVLGYNGIDNSSYCGVYGYSVRSYGIFGYATSNYGVYGNANGDRGVHGHAVGDYGVSGSAIGDYGVYGNVVGNYGVYGQAGGGAQYGLYSANNCHIAGTLSKGAGACLTIDEFWNNTTDTFETGDVVVLNEDQSLMSDRHYSKPISCVRLCDSAYDHKVVGVKVFEDLAHSGKGSYEKSLEEDQFFDSIENDYTIDQIKALIDSKANDVEGELNEISDHDKKEFDQTKEDLGKLSLGKGHFHDYLSKEDKTDREKKRFLLKKVPVIVEVKGHHGYTQKTMSNFYVEERKKWDKIKCEKTKPNRRFVVGVLGQYGKCKVDADIAPIQVGDLLTTSPTKGHAQKVLDKTLAIGSIFAQALEAKASGKGLIKINIIRT